MTRTTSPTRRTFAINRDSLTLDDLEITFQRTLRVSENGINALPPGLGRFPLRAVDPAHHNLSPTMVTRGGVLMPLYMREAMWLSFSSDQPVAIQIGTGGRCVVSGTALGKKLRRRKQNYVVVPEQPWIDGFKTGDGEVRQFVAVPAGSGLSAESQLTGSDSVGGIQIQVWHLTPAALKRWKAAQRREQRIECVSGVVYCAIPAMASMAVGAGGAIRQEIYPDTFAADDWQTTPTARVWVHLVGAGSWRAITGEVPPPTPVTTESYVKVGLPWFDLYDVDKGDLPTSDELAALKSVGALLGEDDDTPVVSTEGAGLIRFGTGPRTTTVNPGDWKWC